MIDASLFDDDHVLLLRGASDKRAVLDRLARLAAPRAGIPAARLLEALLAREQLGSTGTGGGVAIPHARPAGLGSPVGALARLRRAAAWDAVDNRPVDLVCLLLTDAQDADTHLTCLASVSRRLRDPAATRAMREAADAASLRAAFLATGVS